MVDPKDESTRFEEWAEPRFSLTAVAQCTCGSHPLAPLYHRPDCPAAPLEDIPTKMVNRETESATRDEMDRIQYVATAQTPAEQIIETILFRRALEHKLEGYTLETSKEIASALDGMP